jgi:nucleoside diphosphate kinase
MDDASCVATVAQVVSLFEKQGWKIVAGELVAYVKIDHHIQVA